jgi:hypothetical protein
LACAQPQQWQRQKGGVRFRYLTYVQFRRCGDTKRMGTTKQQPEVRRRMCWKSGEVWKLTKHALNCTVLLSYRAILMFLVQTFSCPVATHGHVTIETKNKKTDARRRSLVFSAALLQLRSIVRRPPLPRATRVVHFCRATISHSGSS